MANACSIQKEIRIQDGSAPNIMHEFYTIVHSVTRLEFPGRIGFFDSDQPPLKAPLAY